MKCKDYLITGEEFEVVFDKNYDMFVTSPFPKIEKLGDYYQSEEYTSHTDGGAKTLIDRLYIIARNILLKRKVKLVKKYLKDIDNTTLLDYGCGTGEFLSRCESAGLRVEGIEPNANANALASKKIKGNISNDTDLSKKESGKYDVITMWHVLEHIPDLTLMKSEMKRMLKDKGTLIIAVPNFKSYDAQFYKEYWAAYDVPRHLWHFSKTAISKHFAEVEMEVIKTKPMWLDSYYVSMLSEKNKNTNKLLGLIRAFCIGILSNLYYCFKKESSSHIFLLKNTSK